MSDSPDEIPLFTPDGEPNRALLPPEIVALLDFEPVPRDVVRPNGWTPARQRRFIVHLAATGSPRQAAEAMEKELSGAKHLYRSEDGESFRAAWRGAMEFAAARKQRERSQKRRFTGEIPGIGGLSSPAFAGDRDAQSVRGTDEHRRDRPQGGGGAGAFSDQAEFESESAGRELATALIRKFVIKLRQERTARLAGRIAEADFYLRQISFFEVALDLLTTDAIDALANLRRDGTSLLEIADTESTRMLDRTRRKAWLELALERRSSPGRGGGPSNEDSMVEGAQSPDEHDDPDLDIFPPHLLAEGHDFRSEPLPYPPYNRPAEDYDWDQWADLGDAERERAYDAQYARAAAEEQVKWEAEMLSIARTVKETGRPYED